MKRILAGCALALSLFFNNSLYAQGAHDATIRFAKNDRPGMVADFPFPHSLVEDALRERLRKVGMPKPKSEKGFIFYQGANWTEVSPAQVDVYAKVDGKGDKSTVMLLVSKGYDNYVSTATDAVIAQNMKTFLDGLTASIQSMQLMQSIGAQEEAMKRAEKAYNDSKDDGAKLDREREKLEKQIAENKSEQSKREGTWNDEKGKLDQLKAQVK